MAILVVTVGVVTVTGSSYGVRAEPAASCTALSGTAWATAVWSCGHVPTLADAVTIPTGVTLTVAGAAEAGALTLTTSGTRLSLASNATLSIAGTLIVSPGVPYASLVIGSGWLRFVGESRELFNANWEAATVGWHMEFALDEGAVGTASRAIKAGELRFTSGTVATTSDIRPDDGLDNTGIVTIAAGAVLSTTGNIERTGTAGAQSSTITVDGTLATSGSRISANTIAVGDGGTLRVKRAGGLTIAGALSYDPGATLAYAGSSTQTTNGELTANVGGLAVENSAGVALSKPVTVTGELALTAGSLAAGSHVVTLGSDATCSGSGDVTGSVQRNSLALATAYCFGHPDVQLTFTSDTLPTAATVTLANGAAPFAGAVLRTYAIGAPGFGGTATVRLHYLASELNGNDSANLRLWRNGGTRWEVVGRSSGDSSSVTVTGVTAFSDWALSEHGTTTAATIVDFRATRIDGGVQVTWSTAMEDLNAGFRLYRAQELYGPALALHPELLPAQGDGFGHDYIYVDEAGDLPAPIFYWIEDVDLAGTATRHGPAVVSDERTYLPYVAQ